MNKFNQVLTEIIRMADNNIVNLSSFKEDIYIEGHGVLYYTLSNDLNKICEAIYLQTGITDFSFIERFGWRENFRLSENVKKVMKRLNVTYSTTFSFDGEVEYFVINKYSGGRWFIAL